MEGGSGKRLQSKVISSAADGAANQSPERGRRKEKWVTERQELPVEDEGKNRRRLQDPVALEDTADDGNVRNFRRPLKRGRFEQNPAGGAAERPINPEYVPRSGHFFEHDDRSTWRPRAPPRRRPYVEGGRTDDRGPFRKPDERWDGGIHEQADRGTDRWHHDRFFEHERSEVKKGGRHDELLRNRGRRIEGNVGRFRDGDRWLGRRPGNLRMNGRGNAIATQMDRGRWGEEEDLKGRNNAFAKAARLRGPVPNGNIARDARGNTRELAEWKHDLFDQRNHSPAAKREEASVARVEALLAA